MVDKVQDLFSTFTQSATQNHLKPPDLKPHHEPKPLKL